MALNDPLDKNFEKAMKEKEAKTITLAKFLKFANMTEGRDKIGKIIQFWTRCLSYFLRNVRQSQPMKEAPWRFSIKSL